jgi:hypothetical protein
MDPRQPRGVVDSAALEHLVGAENSHLASKITLKTRGKETMVGKGCEEIEEDAEESEEGGFDFSIEEDEGGDESAALPRASTPVTSPTLQVCASQLGGTVDVDVGVALSLGLGGSTGMGQSTREVSAAAEEKKKKQQQQQQQQQKRKKRKKEEKEQTEKEKEKDSKQRERRRTTRIVIEGHEKPLARGRPDSAGPGAANVLLLKAKTATDHEVAGEGEGEGEEKDHDMQQWMDYSEKLAAALAAKRLRIEQEAWDRRATEAIVAARKVVAAAVAELVSILTMANADVQSARVAEAKQNAKEAKKAAAAAFDVAVVASLAAKEAVWRAGREAQWVLRKYTESMKRGDCRSAVSHRHPGVPLSTRDGHKVCNLNQGAWESGVDVRRQGVGSHNSGNIDSSSGRGLSVRDGPTSVDREVEDAAAGMGSDVSASWSPSRPSPSRSSPLSPPKTARSGSPRLPPPRVPSPKPHASISAAGAIAGGSAASAGASAGAADASVTAATAANGASTGVAVFHTSVHGHLIPLKPATAPASSSSKGGYRHEKTADATKYRLVATRNPHDSSGGNTGGGSRDMPPVARAMWTPRAMTSRDMLKIAQTYVPGGTFHRMDMIQKNALVAKLAGQVHR